MIAGTGRDERLFHERSVHDGGRSVADREREGDRVNDQCIHRATLLNLDGQGRKAVARTVAGIQAEHLANLVGFLLVQAEDDFEVTVEAHDDFKGARDVLLRALLGIGEVEENLPARERRRGAELLSKDSQRSLM